MIEELTIDVYDLDERARDAAAAAEVRGARTKLMREGRPAAIILSWDEYLSLTETIAIAAGNDFAQRVGEGDEEMRRGNVSAIDGVPESISISRSAAADFARLDGISRAEAVAALGEIGQHAIAGAPLHDPFRGLWSWRGARIRIVYRIAPHGNAIGVVFIGLLPGVSA